MTPSEKESPSRFKRTVAATPVGTIPAASTLK
jgi:hypothetical protein